MEENPIRIPRKDGTHQASRTGPTGKNHRCPVDDDTGDLMGCSGKSCRSCTAGMIADCVAVCCCPCAVVNILALAFLKAPLMLGRRCLGLGKKKRQKLEKKRKCGWDCVEDKDGISEIGWSGFSDEELKDNYSARFEAEKVWLELYQVGHLGFGRVSFTGIQSLGKGN